MTNWWNFCSLRFATTARSRARASARVAFEARDMVPKITLNINRIAVTVLLYIWLCHAAIWLLYGTISARPLCLQRLPLRWRCNGIVSGTSPKRRGAKGRERATACERGNGPREGSDRATGRGRSSRGWRARTRQPPRRPGVGPAFFWR